jgi:LuxR family transcriptional regulator, maltose regulon positive regulatory protein
MMSRVIGRMSLPLLATKLHFPQARTSLIGRPRLVEQLTALQFPGRRLGIISAPAGFGKTTLVVQWLENPQTWPACWVSLDARDNQPAVFFNYLISALQAVVPEAGRSALDLLPLPGVNFEEVITLLVNDLAKARSSFVLILDDFHHVDDPLILQTLDLLMDVLPSQMRLLLLTREDPALQLALRRANNQLVELRQEDLRFDLAEAIEFLNQSMGLQLVSRQVQVLEARTEGWIAGLQLAALSLQHSPDVDGFIHALSGSNRFILDYLMEEVLSKQPQEIQDFIFETSTLEHLCAGLCAAVTQKTAGSCQKLLESLVRANMFVISLDEERCWYRYHHMFRDLLLARFRAEAPERLGELCRRASEWYERNGDLRLAVEFSFKAHDLARAADLLEMHFADRWQVADKDYLFLIDQLPFDVIKDRPELCLDSAGLWLTAGQYARIPPFLDAAERCLCTPDLILAPPDSANLVFAQAIRAFLGDICNQPIAINESFRQAFLDMPEEYAPTRQSVAMLLEAVCYMAGDFPGVMYYCQDAIERDKRIKSTIGIPMSVMRMVLVLQAQGKLGEALNLVREYEAYVRQHGARRFHVGGVLNLLWGDLLLEWNRLDEAEAQIREGLRLLEDWSIPQYVALGLSLLTHLQIAKGDLEEAGACMQKAEALYHEGEFHPIFRHALQRAQMRLWIAEQNVPALEAFARKTLPLTEKKFAFRAEEPLIELCRAWIALSRSEQAAALLNRLATLAGDRNGRRLEILTLLAAAEWYRPAVAQKILEEALHLGQTEGFLRTFIDAGEPLRQELNLWLQHTRSEIPASLRSYADRIYLEFDHPPRQQPGAAALAELLTQRELDVLRLLIDGNSNRQIAETLCLSEGTVKFYVHNILQKLGVESRTQAIARARVLKLLGK